MAKRRKKQIETIKKAYLILIFFLLILSILTYCLGKRTNSIETSEVLEDKNGEEEQIQEEIEERKKEIDSHTSDWELILVNKENPIPEDYASSVEPVENGHQGDIRITEALSAMLADARKSGIRPMICSSYRESKKQEKLFAKKTQEYRRKGYPLEQAKDKASYWVSPPRTSEHEVGLAFDIVSISNQVLDERQENMPVQKWLMKHCHEYGFVLRYPTDKKEITQINYEPWHYRYVGVENAIFMKERGFCLEEYIEYLKSFE